MPLMKRRVDTPQSVTGRALSILGAFGPPHPTLTLSEISDRSGLPLTTTFRLLGELVEWGALVRNADRRYRIGPRLVALATLADPPAASPDRHRQVIAPAHEPRIRTPDMAQR